jgi:C1A family cysteine protease
MVARVLASLVALASAQSFEGWCEQHQQCNFNGEEEKEKRRAIFEEHKSYIEKVNSEQDSFKLSLNLFAIKTLDEMPLGADRSMVPAKDSSMPVLGRHELSTEVADAVDWQQAGFVTPVKNQGGCGSCWAFATTASVESAYSVRVGAWNFVDASEQQLVDCSGGYGNQGCNGGWPSSAMQYQQAAGVCSGDSYPYHASDGACADSSCNRLPFGVAGYQSVQANSEDALRAALNQGTVAVTVLVDDNFQLYNSGVLQGGCNGQINHAVLAVGYGNLDGADFFKLKNSWGDSWGWAGYILVAASGGNTACIVSQESAFPALAMSAEV